MKRKRVVASGVVLTLILVAFFTIPLPVSRVRETGLVQVSETCREYVHPHDSGILTDVFVRDGQYVNAGHDLARFQVPQDQFDRQQTENERDAAAQMMNAIKRELSKGAADAATRIKLENALRDAQSTWDEKKARLAGLEQRMAQSEVLKAPRAGMVMGSPRKEDLLRMWDKSDGHPFCTIGDPDKLRVLIPVNAFHFREIRKNLDRVRAERGEDAYLEVSILPARRSDKQFTGRITHLPDTDEKNVPLQLTHRGGGSLATKPGGDPNVNQPLVQTYLIPIEVDDPDDTLMPGTLATVKVHLEWRSAAWWAWRSIASALDVGLW